MTNRSPVPSARALLAGHARVGDIVAGHTSDGDYAFEVVAIHTSDQQVELTVERHHGGELLTVLVDPLLPLVALTRHYGSCSHCGRLAPCPDDLAERRLERLWETPLVARPLDLAPLALCP